MNTASVHRVAADDFDWSASEGPAAEVRRIADAADAVDGVDNLNEAARLCLRHRGLSGGSLDLADQGFALRNGSELDLIVAPDARRAGLGSALAAAALEGYDGPLDAWSHADDPAAAPIAERHGLSRSRDLWVMGRSLDDAPSTPSDLDYTIRSFHPGDEQEVLRVNALAFAHHPEQGHMSLADFQERQAEEWFDPAGLLLAVAPDDEDTVLGFHWTKVHAATDQSPAVGEVYVVAVDPRTAGRGIGKVLTAAGLQHLREAGPDRVILYVDGDNAPAIAVYSGLGFTQDRVEAQYTRD